MVDLHIKNGKNINNEQLEVAVKNGKIVEVGKKLSIDQAKEVLDLKGKSFISAGWIDAHTHAYDLNDLYGDDPDKIGYTHGVTTVVDAGTAGADRIGDFYTLSQKAKTNVYALLNISKVGIVKQNELSDMANIQEDLIAEAIEKYPDFIVGIKARMSQSVVGENGIKPLRRAKEIQKQYEELPLMVHIGSAPPELKEVLELLEAGDIVTHCYNGKENNILTAEDQVRDFVWESLDKGVLFDIGHGTDSFNFEVAELAKAQHFNPYTLSSDIYRRNRRNGPVVDFPTTVEKLLCLGWSLADVLPMITSRPAEMFHLAHKGELAAGFDADITIFDVTDDKEKVLVDSNGNKREATQVLKPEFTIIGGNVYEAGV